jgi:hypothetical protein
MWEAPWGGDEDDLPSLTVAALRPLPHFRKVSFWRLTAAAVEELRTP